MICGVEKISYWESPKISYDLESARLLTKYVPGAAFVVHCFGDNKQQNISCILYCCFV